MAIRLKPLATIDGDKLAGVMNRFPELRAADIAVEIEIQYQGNTIKCDTIEDAAEFLKSLRQSGSASGDHA